MAFLDHCFTGLRITYLIGNSMQVILDGALSNSLQVISGVPQGSVLGLYTIFVLYK